jgi:two-component system nitrogen regulation response regulator GlnG
VLSDGHFYRVGGHQPQKANVRVIAATHQHLEERVRQGLFREDLFHRLNVIRLRLPPLRDRGQDVPLLARHFLARSARELGVEPKRLSEEALARLATFDWPGNVRQLENVCHWLTVMAPAQTVEAKDLPPEIQAAAPRAVPALATEAEAFRRDDEPGAIGAGGPLVGHPPRPRPIETDVAGYPAPRSAAPTAAGGGFGGPVGVTRPSGAPLGTPPRRMPGAHSAPAADAAQEPSHWSSLLEAEVAQLLSAQAARGAEPPGESDVMDQLTRTFESTIIRTALRHTRGRRIDAALRLGIGRNTITRKIQDLRLDED